MPKLSKDIFVFTDCDLDGAMCHLLMQWYTNSHIKYQVTKVDDFRNAFSRWSEKNINKYKTIYILDIDVSQSLDLVDKPNITIIDHHDSHVSRKSQYKNAKTFIEKETSCAKLLYKIFSRGFNRKDAGLNDKQKTLLGLVDDYDSYTLKTLVSKELNTIFWSYQGDRVQKFITDWNTGFNGFTDQHKRIIHFKNKALLEVIKDLEVFTLSGFEFNGETYNICSTISTTSINEVAHHLIDKFKCDISIVVNTKSKKVSFRKNQECDSLNLSILAGSICGGAGHTNAAGGPFNEKFLRFSKLFTRIK
jgi:nanoRNase/pAp phosphatase (c-di-AMP/oligoRNAs hydrolase)